VSVQLAEDGDGCFRRNISQMFTAESNTNRTAPHPTPNVTLRCLYKLMQLISDFVI
jgi:hypothetical protein